MIKTDNPAGRLYAILNEAKNMSHNISTRDVWLKVFKIESKSQTELFRTLTSLQELMDEIKEQLNEADDINKDLYIKYLPNIERVIRVTNLDTSWNSYRESLSDVAMYNLAHCAEILSSRYGESTIEEQELFKLKDEIDTLYEIVRTGSLNKELKIIILDQLEIIRRAIHEYRIRGAKGLHKALRYCYGMIIENHSFIEKEFDKKEVKRWSDILLKVNTLTTTALNLKKIATGIAGMLGWGNNCSAE